eukprot:5977074-Lingulodinium_polyedra.AAC.1
MDFRSSALRPSGSAWGPWSGPWGGAARRVALLSVPAASCSSGATPPLRVWAVVVVFRCIAMFGRT